MAMIKFKDFSKEVQAALGEACDAWCLEQGAEVASMAARNVSNEGWTNSERSELRNSYQFKPGLYEGDFAVYVGSKLEMAFWEEFGTGEYADTSKNGGRPGRKDWWVYTPGSKSPDGQESTHYRTQEEAEMMAKHIKKKYKKKAIATNGRQPNYTLERAFRTTEKRAQKALEYKLHRALTEGKK